MTKPEANAHEVIAAEAADWYARLRGDSVSEMDAARFRTWLAGDPARRQEFEAITRFWDELAAIQDSPEVREAVESITARERQARSVRRRDEHATSRWRARLGIALSAGAAVVASLAIAVFWFAGSASGGRYVTQIGEQRIVPLEDGSVVKLNTATELRLQFTDSMRSVALVSGQATFQVAKDAARPFVVTAGEGQVRALGTVFDVYKAGERVKVTLIEGRVAVLARYRQTDANVEISGALEKAFGSSSDWIVLSAGEQLVYGDGVPASEPVSADVERAVAWQSRKLDFSDTPLQEAIAEANRYSQRKIVLHASHLADARISGTFEAGRNELFAEGLQSYFRLDVEHRDDGSIVLTGSAPSKNH